MGNWKLTRSQEPQALTEPVLREMRKGKTGGLSRRQLIRRSIGAATGLWLLEVGAGTLGLPVAQPGPRLRRRDQPGRLRHVSARARRSPGLTLQDGAPSYFSDARTFVSPERPQPGLPERRVTRWRGHRHQRDARMCQKCPHLGCKPNFCESNFWFECPCHGSRYDRLGVKVQELGPAARGMDRFAHQVEDGEPHRRHQQGHAGSAAGRPGPARPHPGQVADGLHL